MKKLVLASALALVVSIPAQASPDTQQCSEIEASDPYGPLLRIACVAVTIGKLLPAVQKVREAMARRPPQSTSFVAERASSRAAVAACTVLLGAVSVDRFEGGPWQIATPDAAWDLVATPTSLRVSVSHELDITCEAALADHGDGVLHTDLTRASFHDPAAGVTWHHEFATDEVRIGP